MLYNLNILYAAKTTTFDIYSRLLNRLNNIVEVLCHLKLLEWISIFWFDLLTIDLLNKHFFIRILVNLLWLLLQK